MELLRLSSDGRVPNLVQLRYGRMIVSPFTFFRGSAILQAHDLAGVPNTGMTMEICGDAHLLNFGGFATPERQLVFDLNDFDEVAPGPWEWDVKRLVASFVVAARHMRYSRGVAEELVMLSNRFGADPDLPVYISGSREATHGSMIYVLNFVKRSGIDRVAFSVKAEK